MTRKKKKVTVADEMATLIEPVSNQRGGVAPTMSSDASIVKSKANQHSIELRLKSRNPSVSVPSPLTRIWHDCAARNPHSQTLAGGRPSGAAGFGLCLPVPKTVVI